MHSFLSRRRSALTALAVAALCAAALIPPLALSQGRQNCNDLLAYYREAARAPQIYYEEEEETAVAVEEETEEAEFAFDDSMDAGNAMAGDDGALPAAGGGSPADLGARSETGTNIQVAGVDESDIVKTNGSEIFVLRDDSLVVVSVQEDPPQVIGGLTLNRSASISPAEPREMLLAGDRLLIFRNVFYDSLFWSRQGLQIVEVDVSNPARPRALRTLNAYGQFVTARLAGSGLRVVMRHDGADSPTLTPRLGETWEQRIRRSGLSTWLPLYTLTNSAGARSWGLLAPCDAVQIPATEDRRYSSTETTLLLSFNLADGIGDWDAAGFIGSTDAVYASADALYVASSFGGWISNTRIHRWDTPPGAAPVYQGAAEVEGWLINQFAMSEYRGKLRVATTLQSSWPISSRLTIFDIGEDGLTELSKLDGLGPSERIYAVRFLGELGYVVTFRLIDPLYVLDLSDPENPAVAGELKIPGFSSYLHPLGGGLLLGVGQNADPRTGQPLGLQVSLFDVSDPTEPTRLDQVDLSERSRSATFEHRAFTYHQGRAYIPASPTNDLFAVRITPKALELERQITAQDEVLRSLPINNRLHLLLEDSLATHNLTTLDLLNNLNLVPPSSR